MRPGLGQQEDVATVDVPESERALETIPPREPVTPLEWLKVNLFPSPVNSVLTVLTAILAAWLTYAVVRWMFVTADWTVVKANFRLFMVGRFPLDQLWRVWVALYVVLLLAGLTWGRTGRRMEWTKLKTVRRILIGVAGLLLFRYLVESPLVWGLTAGAVGTLVVATYLGRIVGPASRTMRGSIRWAWLLIFPFVVIILQVAGGVGPLKWGGVLLNILVAVVGIVISFPIGMLLALGRRSSFPAVRTVCVAVIEFVRGAPLYTWLLFGVFLLPFLLPPGVVLPQIIRVMMMFILFSSAYVAEIVRGGLQGVHHGQYEAARALGLPTTRMMALIILPQALRNTIPAMISHFISLFKDTSLLAIIGFIEALRVARISSAAAEFVGTSRQTLLFAALIFWIGAFSMSRWSQRLERRLGVGER